MSRDLILTVDQEDINGMFWLPSNPEEQMSGSISLRSSKSPTVRLARFAKAGSNLNEGIHPQRVIHGHDSIGSPITLINCWMRGVRTTLTAKEYSLDCEAAIFGAVIPSDQLFFDSIRLYFDNQNEWVNQYPFGSYSPELSPEVYGETLSSIKIPFLKRYDVPLNLHGYSDSKFYLSWSVNPGVDDFHLQSRSYLDLDFEKPKDWEQVLMEVYKWRRFISLAMKDSIRIEELILYKNDHHRQGHPIIRLPLKVWMERKNLKNLPTEKASKFEFHFTYADVKQDFHLIFKKWVSIQESWEAVLHRFFAVSEPRSLYVNEKFLFLAQAVESLHRARTGQHGEVDMQKAAKEAWLGSPPKLQEILGPRGVFINQLCKSRNYWTHFGKPGPKESAEILDDRRLLEFNTKLRCLIEAAILREIGIPEAMVEKTWAGILDFSWIDFK